MPTTLELEKNKQQLIDRLGVYIENQDKLPPLAARIYATLVLTGKKGLTFEQLVTSLKASKSTVCTHLNTLQNCDMLSFYSKEGDRKKYFIIAPNRLTHLIEEITNKWEKQKNLQQDILTFKTLFNKENPDDPFDLEFHREYLIFLDEASNSILRLKHNLQKNNLINV